MGYLVRDGRMWPTGQQLTITPQQSSTAVLTQTYITMQILSLLGSCWTTHSPFFHTHSNSNSRKGIAVHVIKIKKKAKLITTSQLHVCANSLKTLYAETSEELGHTLRSTSLKVQLQKFYGLKQWFFTHMFSPISQVICQHSLCEILHVVSVRIPWFLSKNV